MKISDICISRPVSTAMFFIAITLLGFISYRQLNVQIVPDISFPGLGVYARIDGTPEEIEEKVTTHLESMASSMPKVKEIRSYVGNWGTWMTVTFEYDVDMRFAIIDFTDKLNRFRKNFDRRQFYARARHFDTSFAKWLFMEIVIKSETDRASIRTLAVDKIQQQLEDISGIAEVDVGGDYWRTIDINLNKDKMIHYQIPFNRLMSKLGTVTNEDMFIGDVKDGNNTYYVKLGTKLENLDQLIEKTSQIRRFVDKCLYNVCLSWIEKTGNLNDLYIANRKNGSIHLNARRPLGKDVTLIEINIKEFEDLAQRI